MTAEILAVGTELLMGQIANTDAQYISTRLAELGINLYFHTVVGDNAERLEETLKRALERSDIVITTGGLGPTKDDLTKETISKTMNRQLVLHADILQNIRDFFEKKHRKMVEINVKQAYLPENSIVIPNLNGTAPGCIIEDAGKTIIMLPGPPKEMQPMFDNTVFEYLKKRTKVILVSKMLKIIGIGESDLETRLMDLIESQENPTIAPYASQGEITVRVTARCTHPKEAEAMLTPIIDEIKCRLGDLLYAEDGQSLEEVVFSLLKENKLSFATAESCTGGLLAGRITNISGASEVFDRGYITYSIHAKSEDLGVSYDIINKYGAVSKQTALAMIDGLKQRSKASVGVAITGIAGPSGGTADKPVGTVYIASYVKERVWCKEFELMGNRERIRNDACLRALDMVRRQVLGIEQQ